MQKQVFFEKSARLPYSSFSVLCITKRSVGKLIGSVFRTVRFLHHLNFPKV